MIEHAIQLLDFSYLPLVIDPPSEQRGKNKRQQQQITNGKFHHKGKRLSPVANNTHNAHAIVRTVHSMRSSLDELTL